MLSVLNRRSFLVGESVKNGILRDSRRNTGKVAARVAVEFAEGKMAFVRRRGGDANMIRIVRYTALTDVPQPRKIANALVCRPEEL